MMAWDLSNHFNTRDAPEYLVNENPATVAHALAAMMNARYAADLRKSTDPVARQRAELSRRMREDVYDPWMQDSTLKTKPGVGKWVREYWDWLREGAKTRTWVASTEQDVEKGFASQNALHYVEGVGYTTEGDLAFYNPLRQQAMSSERKRAEETEGKERYWESDIMREGTPAYWKYHTNLGLSRNIYKKPALDQYFKTVQGKPQPAANWPPTRTATGGAGLANRNGNFAATSVPGQVAKTPAGVQGGTMQHRQTVAKRVGRDISQAGVTRLSNAREEFSRRYRQQFRKW